MNEKKQQIIETEIAKNIKDGNLKNIDYDKLKRNINKKLQQEGIDTVDNVGMVVG